MIIVTKTKKMIVEKFAIVNFKFENYKCWQNLKNISMGKNKGRIKKDKKKFNEIEKEQKIGWKLYLKTRQIKMKKYRSIRYQSLHHSFQCLSDESCEKKKNHMLVTVFDKKFLSHKSQFRVFKHILKPNTRVFCFEKNVIEMWYSTHFFAL